MKLKIRTTVILLIPFVVGHSASARAQEAEKEPVAILEAGAAASRSVTDSTSSYGPSAAVEIEPIKNWLEIEAGVTPLFAKNSTEWNIDVLFKKPWELSKKAEFMAGVGPEWVHSNKADATPNSVSFEAAADFMYWPSGKRRYGWYIEPAYEYNFGRGREQSLGVSGGLLIAIP